jgi:hypothetical protein
MNDRGTMNQLSRGDLMFDYESSDNCITSLSSVARSHGNERRIGCASNGRLRSRNKIGSLDREVKRRRDVGGAES